MMQYFAATYPGICRVDTFGTSAGGRLLLALNISDQVDADEPEPDFLYTAAIHGDELVGIVLLLRLAHTLLEGYGQDVEVDRLVEGLSIWINPLSNPDGTYEADQGLSMKGAQRFNLEGVDLNRDFPDPGLDLSGDTTGRAPETIAMMVIYPFCQPPQWCGGGELPLGPYLCAACRRSLVPLCEQGVCG
jgi:murein tripeptide amidase MpaA